MISERLQALVDEMVDKGVRFDEAAAEFEKRFIARVVADCDGSLGRSADALGLHRNTLARKLGEHRLKRR